MVARLSGKLIRTYSPAWRTAQNWTVDGPAIVDAVVASDETPNMPHVELEQVGNFALAKIKEAVLAVTGG
jgi:pyruvate dehydrogenase (quinone)